MLRPHALCLVVLIGVLAVAGCLGGDGARHADCPPFVADGPGAYLQGEVYRADGAAVRDAYVEARGPLGLVLHTRTVDGSACFGLEVRAGDWTVTAAQDGWAGASTVTLGANETVVVAVLMHEV